MHKNQGQKNKKKKWLYIGGGIVVIIILLVWLGGKKPEPVYSTVEVVQGELVQTVSETGTIKPLQKIELNFPQTGKIAKILVRVGDRVIADQVLAELDYSSLLIREQEAQAALDLALANQDKLKRGATAAEIAVLAAQVSQAKAAYEGAANDYDKTRASVAETINQAEKKLSDLEDETAATPTALEQAVAIAQLNLNNGRTSYQQAIDNAENNFLTAADYDITVANSALDKILTILNDDDLENILSVKNISYKIATENYYNDAKDLKAAADSALAAARLSGAEADFNALNTAVAAYLNATFQALNNCYSALENTITTSGMTQTELDAFKTTVNTQITAVNTGLSSLQTAKYNLDNAFLSYSNNIASLTQSLTQAEVNLSEGITTARNSLSSARLTGDKQIAAAKTAMEAAKEAWGVADRQLTKLKAPARSEDLSSAEAQVRQAQSNLELIKKQQADSVLKSPIDGQIVALNYEVGEQFSGAKAMFEILTENNFEIEADISETDISKVKIDDRAIITFDALGESHKFKGRVSAVEPSATVIQGVIYYKVKVALEHPPVGDQEYEAYSLIKPEMSANLVVYTDSRSGALLVPSRAVLEKNGQGNFVRILDGKDLREVPVTIGLRGDGGLVEIVNGDIKLGELAVTFVK
ncbi:MAG: HlyD family efflux transporter periplasmic adaptor subunit [Patescibacteria group bacterium]